MVNDAGGFLFGGEGGSGVTVLVGMAEATTGVAEERGPKMMLPAEELAFSVLTVVFVLGTW